MNMNMTKDDREHPFIEEKQTRREGERERERELRGEVGFTFRMYCVL